MTYSHIIIMIRIMCIIMIAIRLAELSKCVQSDNKIITEAYDRLCANYPEELPRLELITSTS